MSAADRARRSFVRIVGVEPETAGQEQMMKRSGVYQRALFHEHFVDLGNALLRTAPSRLVNRVLEMFARPGPKR